MSDDATIVRYEPCPDCTDGSCRKCGPESGENCAPGVRLVIRKIRFVPCGQCKGTGSPMPLSTGATVHTCSNCGPQHAHALAAPGVAIEIADEYAAKRWVPVMHLRRGDGPSCGTKGVEADRLTTDRTKVKCGRCLK